MTDLEVARDLRAAAEYLRVHGWVQGTLEDNSGRRCAVGALHMDWADHHDEVLAAATAMGFNCYCSSCENNLVEWNNAPGRTTEEVIDRLESAALNLEIKALAGSAESLAAERLELVPSA